MLVLLRHPWSFALAVACAHAAAAAASLELTRAANGLAALWPANAIVLVAMLLRPNACRATAVTVMTASFAINLLFGNGIGLSASFGAANTFECLAIVALLRRAGISRLPDIADTRHLAAFGVAVGIAAAMSGTIAGTALAVWTGQTFAATWSAWFIADVLGQLFVAPLLILAVRGLRERRAKRVLPRQRVEFTVLMGAIAAVASTVFSQSTYPLLFLVHPIVALATLRLGVAGATIATIIVAIIATAGSAYGLGPIAAVDLDTAGKAMLLQLFLATVFVGALPIASLLAQRDAAARSARRDARRYQEVVAAVGDVIFTTDLVGNWTFLNPAWERITGHSVDTSIGVHSQSFVLPADLPALREAIAPFERGEVAEVRHSARYLHAQGGIRWIEIVLRLLFDDAGEAIGSAGMLTDVSDRRQSQDLAEQARRLAERRANSDELTGLASRRAVLAALDDAVDTSRVSRAPLVLALIDVDHFKAINDTLGHGAGDAVLRQFGRVAAQAVRTTDLIGRIGGEEFALIMPATDLAPARATADRLRREIEQTQFDGAPGRRVTISVGVAQLGPHDDASSLLKDADEALYAAKSRGRNRLAIAA